MNNPSLPTTFALNHWSTISGHTMIEKSLLFSGLRPMVVTKIQTISVVCEKFLVIWSGWLVGKQCTFPVEREKNSIVKFSHEFRIRNIRYTSITLLSYLQFVTPTVPLMIESTSEFVRIEKLKWQKSILFSIGLYFAACLRFHYRKLEI